MYIHVIKSLTREISLPTITMCVHTVEPHPFYKQDTYV